MNNYANTIAAISTPPGKGGVAIIRISGSDALDIASKVFRPASKKDFCDAVPRMQIRGDIYYGSDMIDDGMATYFKAPNSYTGEDTVEIACHGGALVTRTVLEATLAFGAVVAEPGEFTRRAFINGKISLTEAEAIGNLLEAESREQIKLSAGKSRELLASKVAEIRADLTSVLSSIYARIDYPDEDLGDFTDEETVQILSGVRAKIETLIATYQTGKAINEGIKTVICGKPNVGKSSIYNLLLGRDAAIVTDVEGTTRDVLSEKIPLGRVMLNLSDTAGVRSNTKDVIEKIGIDRSYEKIADSELILAVFDLSREFDAADGELIEKIRKSSSAKIALLNKADLEAKFPEDKLDKVFDLTLKISAEKGETDAIAALTEAVDSTFTDEKISVGNEAIIASARQNAELARAKTLLDSAIEAYELGISTDAASSDVELALGAIAELDGKAVSEEVVADIFSKFCVGK
ncbi:MAG: tRNA uridine-5-carboxymethylaminomethyl(34) synthesis GTPase MnmE [Ruminococcaceae bacterium]|nr:tRNA uridine-5-carboxymethylaminomethyl(34) synthesis GTPase MnmE [Oscillospiraceae bacterium]